MEKQEDQYEWIDDCFRIQQQKWGTHDSYDKEGKCIITSLTYESCLSATRWYLKAKQDGFVGEEVKKYESVVGGKL